MRVTFQNLQDFSAARNFLSTRATLPKFLRSPSPPVLGFWTLELTNLANVFPEGGTKSKNLLLSSYFRRAAKKHTQNNTQTTHYLFPVAWRERARQACINLYKLLKDYCKI